MEFLGAGFGDAFISVLAIIGIILVGGFLIFFLGDLVLSFLDPEYVHFWQRKKNGEKVKDKQSSKEKYEKQAWKNHITPLQIKITFKLYNIIIRKICQL